MQRFSGFSFIKSSTMGCLPSCLGYVQHRLSHIQTCLNQTGTRTKSTALAFEGFSWGRAQHKERETWGCAVPFLHRLVHSCSHKTTDFRDSLPLLKQPFPHQWSEHPRHSSKRACFIYSCTFLFVLSTVKSIRREKSYWKERAVQKTQSY